MKKSGQFILFESLKEFEDWLNKKKVWRKITKIQQHHTWKPTYDHFKGDLDGKVEKGENHIQMLKNLDYYHERVMKFADSAHHFMTFPDGVIALARPLWRKPAGIYGSNTGAICIEHSGNFDKGGDVMTEQHKKTIIGMTAILCKRFNLQPDTNTIIYHHWFDLNNGKRTNGNWGYTKTCPGTNFFGGNKVKDAKKYFIPLVKQYMAGEIVKEVFGMFKDIDKASSWAKDKIKRAKELGIIKGDNLGLFHPKKEVTREALAVVAVNLYEVIMKEIDKKIG